MSDAYDRLLERVKDIGRLQAVAQLLGWDQETYMPKEGARARSEQFALINGLAHERLVADETRALLEAVTHPAGDYLAETNIRETRRVFERAAKIPTALVKEIAGTTSIATEVWAAAREESDFGKLQPYLEKLVDLKKQEAEYVGYDTEAYDALMDEYEPGSKASEIEVLLRELREATVTLLNRIKAAERQPDPGILTQHFDVDKQKAWSRKLAKAPSLKMLQF